MRLFKHKPEKVQEPTEGSVIHKAAQVIAGVILYWQGKIARLLNSTFSSLSHRTQQGCLLFFCLLFGGCSFWLLLQALWPGHGGIPLRSFTSHLPYLEEPVRKEAGIPPDLHLKELQRVQRIRDGLHALSQTAAGRHSCDSLLLVRPGLLDSIYFLEQLHSSHIPLLKTK